MPDFGSATFSQTDASNATGTMPSWSGAAAPSTLDDAGRALQGAVTREWNWRNFTVTATGTADAKVLTYSVAPAAYYNGQRFAFIANTTNTTTATLNVNSLGAKTIKKDVSGTLTNLTASEMVSGMFIEVAYNTANDCFVWVNRGIDAFPAGSVSAPSITTNGDTNTGFWFPAVDTIAASTGGSERLRVDASGNVGVGKTPVVTLDVAGQVRTMDGTVDLRMLPVSGSSAGLVGTLSNHAVVFTQNGIERTRIDTSGNVLVTSSGGLGYGTGSGGTVTQLTSKATGVTLNKANGSIVMNNAALAASTTVTFTVTNSTVASGDIIILCSAGGGTVPSYNFWAQSFSGAFNVNVRNISGGSLSEALVINFAVIKSVNA